MSDGLMCHYCRSYRCVCPERTGGEVSDLSGLTKEELLAGYRSIDVLESTRNPFHVELLRRLSASKAPAAPQVDVEGIAREIVRTLRPADPGSWDANMPYLLNALTRARTLPPAPSPQGWVRVEDELPKVGAWCWVVVGGVVQRMAANLAGDEWEWADRGADFAPKDVVSHWQPLPASPSAHPGEESR